MALAVAEGVKEVKAVEVTVKKVEQATLMTFALLTAS